MRNRRPRTGRSVSSLAFSGGALMLAASIQVPAAAHHSTAFYSQETIELEGEFTAVAWVNPHTRFALRTVDSAGREKVWRMEASAISALARRGVTRDLFNVGDRVRVAGHPSTRDPDEFQLTNVLLPDGREASLWLDSPPRWANSAAMIRREERVVDAERENRGYFRVWSVPRPSPVTPLKLELTAAAIAARESFDLKDNFATRCGPQGMPAVMLGPLPFEIVDRGATIELRAEIYDTVRTIHMDVSTPPSDAPASILGYSVGKWEGGDLVVTTTGVNWPYFDNIGTPQSNAVEIVERYTLSDDQTRLDFRVTVRDPATLKGPAEIEGHWLALGGTLARFDCQASRSP
jgi:Family of unknown function (DUF6152)